MTSVSISRVSYPGIALGMLSVFFWSIYNVGSDLGEADGFRAVDLAFFRYAVGGFFLLPVLVFSRRKLPSWPQLLVLCFLVGPVFGLLVANGFRYAPLAHAVAIPPSASIVTATLLVRFVEKERLSSQRIFGIGVLFLALGMLAFDVAEPKSSGAAPWIGDVCFIVSGTFWGTYTFLLARWRLPAAGTAAGIAVLSGIVFTPIYFIWFGLIDLPPILLMEQAGYQGLFGGSLSFLTFAATVSRLGAGRAALFFALVPPSAILMAIPMTSRFPNQLQVASVILATAGIFISLEILRFRRRISRQPSHTDAV